MNELHKLGERTYYIDGLTNVGIYIINDNDIAIIDTGISEFAPKLLEIIKENNWNLKYVINTHSHADHSGGNNYLIEHTNCKLITSKIERAFLRNSKLDIGFLYGGYPLDEYDNQLMHIDEQREILTLTDLPEGLYYFKLPGHHYDMFGIKTPDNVYFVADAVGNQRVIEKEHVLLIYNVDGFLKSLDMIESFDGIVVPSHVNPNVDMKQLIEINRSKINEIINFLIDYLAVEHTHDEIIKETFEHFNIKISYNKYLLINSTIRSYLAYLNNNKKIKTILKDNLMYFVINN